MLCLRATDWMTICSGKLSRSTHARINIASPGSSLGKQWHAWWHHDMQSGLATCLSEAAEALAGTEEASGSCKAAAGLAGALRGALFCGSFPMPARPAPPPLAALRACGGRLALARSGASAAGIAGACRAAVFGSNVPMRVLFWQPSRSALVQVVPDVWDLYRSCLW